MAHLNERQTTNCTANRMAWPEIFHNEMDAFRNALDSNIRIDAI